MIRLKSLLIEQSSNNTVPNVLFVGDSYSEFRYSYANQLIKSETVEGKIISSSKNDLQNILKLLKKNIKSKYTIVSILFGNLITDKVNLTKSTNILSEIIKVAKQFGAKIIIVNNPPSEYKNQSDILNMISKIGADAYINIGDSLRNSNTHDTIVSKWVNVVSSKLNIKLSNSYVDSDTVDTDIDSDTEDMDMTISRVPVPSNAKEFINQWAKVAKEHHTKYGIPASITLAQAGLESAWGSSKLASKYNNYFGITGEYKGNSIKLRDSGGSMLSFRVYPTPQQSYEDHAVLLKKRYTPKEKSATYEDWANSLQQNGYATDPNYASSLISTIEKFGLTDYDQGSSKISMKLADIAKKTMRITSGFGTRNGKHKGIDYGHPVGTKIYAVMPGEVIVASNIDPDGWGNTVKIKHTDGSSTLYAHLSDISVSVGDSVSAGTLLGKTGGEPGATGAGNSKGPHLHWEYYPNGSVAADGEDVADDYFVLS